MGGSYSAPPPPDYTPMIKQMELMREQQAAAAQDAASAQRKAMIDSQDNAARLGMTQANTAANQDLMRMNEYRKSLDATAAAQNAQQAAGMGQGVTGGGFDINAMNQARYSNLGAGASLLPSYAGNAGLDSPSRNPVYDKMANSFTSPNITGLTFGGN